MKKRSLPCGYIIEFIITLSLWLIWLYSASAAFSDMLSGAFRSYVNGHFWLYTFGAGVLLSIILGIYSYRQRFKIKRRTSEIRKSTRLNEETIISNFFDLNSDQIKEAKKEKYVNVNFFFEDMKCELGFSKI